jgi:hypothetical protein
LREREKSQSPYRGESGESVTRGRIAGNLYQIRASGIENSVFAKAKFLQILKSSCKI